MSSLLIEDVKVVCRGKKLEPLKVKFAHCNNPVNVDANGILKSGIYSDSLNDKEYVAICQAGTMCYMGDTKLQKEERVYIALKNKLTNKVKLVEVSKVSLSPTIQFPSSTNPLLLEKEKGRDKKSREEMSKDFVHRFGMLRGQRLYDQAERLTVKAETVRANLENAAVSTAVEDSELILPKSTDSFEMMLPPRKSEANVASDVYLLENIVSFNDLVALEEAGRMLLTDDFDHISKTESADQFSVYFSKELNSLKSSTSIDAEKKLLFSKALLYTEGLIKLCSISKKKLFHDVVNNHLPSIIPDTVKGSIRGKFTCQEGPNWVLTKMCRERTICHIIALALVIGNCMADAESLSSSLKTDIDSLDPLIRVVGARLVKDKSNEASKIVLSIPLAAPPHKRGQVKRKDKYRN